MKCLIDFWKNMFDFKGTLSFLNYWIPLIICNLIGHLASFGPEFLILSYIIVSAIASISAGVRRLHDAGYSGLLMFLLLIPFGALVLLVLLLLPSQKVSNKFLESED